MHRLLGRREDDRAAQGGVVAGCGRSAWRVKVSGLKGGHSGVDIHQGRGNALRILGTVLQTLLGRLPVGVAAVNGGSAQNAIPREAAAVLVVERLAKESELRSLLAKCEAEWKADLGGFDPGWRSRVEKVATPGRCSMRRTRSGSWTCW